MNIPASCSFIRTITAVEEATILDTKVPSDMEPEGEKITGDEPSGRLLPGEK